ncbi:MAG TPA: lipid-A-disaccharide synthase [Gemmataceae bacterium]
MHYFLSAGEPSGDLHGSNLARALRRLDPAARLAGFGGGRMEAVGARLLYPLARVPVMWFAAAIARIPFFYRLLRNAERYLEEQRPDAVILIDYPGFNFALAKRARRAGIPVFYFVPPQMWGWAGWRVKKMRRLIDHTLCTLTFEYDWYSRRGVRADLVGHPYFDELAAQAPDRAFLESQRGRGGEVVALLPGSRMSEVRRNFPMMVRAAQRVRSARPDVRFLVASFNEEQAAAARALLAKTDLPAEVHVGRTPEIIELAAACVSVSGSVSLELMHRLKPTVIVYKISRFGTLLKNLLLRCRFITLVNLLANEELYPEFLTRHDESEAIAGKVLAWLEDERSRSDLELRLRQLRDRVAQPGACDRAAGRIVEELRRRSSAPRAVA